MKKCLLIYLLVFTLILGLGSVALADADDGFVYTVEEGKAVITQYTGTAENVVIPNTLGGAPVTAIGECAFQFNETMKSLTLNSNLKAIGEAAFSNCEKLEEVVIPAEVTVMGDYAFEGCLNLTAFHVAEENPAYKGVDGVLFSKDGTVLMVYPIGKTNDTYTIPAGVTTVGSCAFSGCEALTQIIIPQGVIVVEEWAFFGTGITSITLPDSVQTVGGSAFECCYSLAAVTLGKGITTVGDGAFCECESLTKVEVPASLTTLGDYVFGWCLSLEEITVAQENANYKDVDGVLFSKDGKTLIQYPPAKEGTSYTVPEGVTAIGNDAFECASLLVSVQLPETLTSIGAWSFNACTALTTMNIPSSVTRIDMAAFQQCENLVSITLPENLTEISDYLFCECKSLAAVIIPETVTVIGENAFSYCNSLTSVILPKGVTAIGYRAFYSCIGVLSITVPGEVASIGEEAFGYYYNEDRYGVLPLEGFVLKGLADSVAERYARKAAIAFERVSESDIPDTPDVPDVPDVPVVPDDPEIAWGDVNEDGTIDAKDALLVLQAAVGKANLSAAQKMAGDVDGNDTLNAVDALLILQKAVHKIEKFPIES